MYAVTLLYAVLSFIAVREVWMQETDYEDYEEQPQSCSISETIRGGNVSYTQGGTEGSMLIYHCGVGRYPFPVSHRLCSADGEWSTMRLASGRQMSQATCKEVLCPAQLELGNGELWPRSQWFRPGEKQSFSCYSGFTLSGSAQRNCTPSGDWTGSIPVCDNQAEDCKDPGVPPGALRSVGRFRTGEKVQYHCQVGLDLLGSAERVCLNSREWSGSEPRCQAAYAFDSPNAVAQAMGGSLSGVMDVLSSEFIKTVTFARTLRVADGRMNVFILMDTSGSITKKQFEKARSATAQLIRKLDSYEVKMKFHVTSYASQAKDIVSITDFTSNDADRVVDRLMEFDHTSHGKQTGTNLYSALYRVYEMMAFLEQRQKNQFNETQNVILIETDGHSNTGPSALSVLAKIRSLLGYSSTAKDHTDEQLLDVYVFGIGDKVNRQHLNAIASRKRKEEHIFILQDYDHLGEVFNSMISDTSVIMCGVAQEKVSLNKKAYTQPWHVSITAVSTTSSIQNCRGSIVTQNWILTAAHCFPQDAVEKPEIVTVKHGEGEVEASAVILHPKYNVKGLQHKNVPEFYDYDIALVKVNEGIPLSWKARPICLPCTKPASRAMKMSPSSTCEQHKNTLLPLEENRAYFISESKSPTDKGPKRKQTHIQTGSKRPSCIKPAGIILETAVDVPLDKYVPDRFLCSGGSESHQDAVTCNGDSGGSLFLLRKLRYFQVGVVSWGTNNVCEPQDRSDKPPPDARDFHISLFSLIPWLKEHLGKDMDFSSIDS